MFGSPRTPSSCPVSELNGRDNKETHNSLLLEHKRAFAFDVLLFLPPQHDFEMVDEDVRAKMSGLHVVSRMRRGKGTSTLR